MEAKTTDRIAAAERLKPHASLEYWSPDEVAECTAAGEEGATYAELWSFVRDGAPVTVREIWKLLSPQAQATVNRAMVALDAEWEEQSS